MTIRNWLVQKLKESFEFDIALEGAHGILIERPHRPLARVYCVETNGSDRFTIAHLDAARREMPGVQFVVLVRRLADNEAYERADQVGVVLSSLGDLKSALNKEINIADFISAEQKYLRSRLEKHRHVSSVRRRGESAYEITRKGTLPTLNIVTITHYELTSDSVYELLEANDDLSVDAIVSTNSNCRGFAGEVLDAGELTETRILSLNQLLGALGDTWT